MTVVFKGEEDASSAAPRRAALRQCETEGSGKVTVDLGEVTFLDASAVADLLRLAESLEHEGRALEIRRPSHDVQKLLLMAGMGLIKSVQFTGHTPTFRVIRRQTV